MVASELTASAAAMGPMIMDEGGAGSSAEVLSSLENRASASKSPFVRSYAESPVTWQLLDQDTVERAKRESKLIFLHIGFKACHCESGRVPV